MLEILTAVKVAFRTQFHFQGSGPHASLCDRQLLAYPVTKHSLNSRDWRRNANQILFKVLPLNGRYVGFIAHTHEYWDNEQERDKLFGRVVVYSRALLRVLER